MLCTLHRRVSAAVKGFERKHFSGDEEEIRRKWNGWEMLALVIYLCVYNSFFIENYGNLYIIAIYRKNSITPASNRENEQYIRILIIVEVHRVRIDKFHFSVKLI